MLKILLRRSDWMFGGVALILFALLVGYVAYTIRFVAMNLNGAIRPDGTGGQLIEQFDFDKLNQLLGTAPPLPGP